MVFEFCWAWIFSFTEYLEKSQVRSPEDCPFCLMFSSCVISRAVQIFNSERMLKKLAWVWVSIYARWGAMPNYEGMSFASSHMEE